MSYIAIDPRLFQKTEDLNLLRPDLQLLGEAGNLAPLSLTPPTPNPGRERLQHLLIGSEDGVQGVINHLHLLRYAERFEWSRLFTIPESGLVILPQPGEVFSYLLRYRQVE
jgi:hypothetical protein